MAAPHSKHIEHRRDKNSVNKQCGKHWKGEDAAHLASAVSIAFTAATKASIVEV